LADFALFEPPAVNYIHSQSASE